MWEGDPHTLCSSATSAPTGWLLPGTSQSRPRLGREEDGAEKYHNLSRMCTLLLGGGRLPEAEERASLRPKQEDNNIVWGSDKRGEG